MAHDVILDLTGGNEARDRITAEWWAAVRGVAAA